MSASRRSADDSPRLSSLLELGRSCFVWSGLVVMALIALLASANAATSFVGTLARIAERRSLLGLAGLAVVALLGIVVVGGTWLMASRGQRGLRAAVVAGFVLVVVVRLGIDAVIDAPFIGESVSFHAMAREMLAGACCFGDRSPGYPLLLAGAYAIFGAGPMAGELLNLLLALLAGAALFALVKRCAGEPAGVVALSLFAIWPAGALIAAARFSETLYVLLLLLAALALLTRAGAGPAALTGGLLALAQYVRPSTLIVLPAYMIARWWPGTSLRGAVLRTALPMTATALLLLTPVLAYNLETHGVLSLATSSFGGWSLYIGTDERTGGRYSVRAQDEMEALTPGGPWEDSNAAGQLAVARIGRDPLLLARLLPIKFNTLWGSETFGVFYSLSERLKARPLGIALTLASSLFWAVVTVGAALTVFTRRRGRLDGVTVLLLGLTITVSALHAFFEVQARYHAYVTPFFIAVAAIGIGHWAARWSSKATEGDAGRMTGGIGQVQ